MTLRVFSITDYIITDIANNIRFTMAKSLSHRLMVLLMIYLQQLITTGGQLQGLMLEIFTNNVNKGYAVMQAYR